MRARREKGGCRSKDCPLSRKTAFFVKRLHEEDAGEGGQAPRESPAVPSMPTSLPVRADGGEGPFPRRSGTRPNPSGPGRFGTSPKMDDTSGPVMCTAKRTQQGGLLMQADGNTPCENNPGGYVDCPPDFPSEGKRIDGIVEENNNGKYPCPPLPALLVRAECEEPGNDADNPSKYLVVNVGILSQCPEEHCNCNEPENFHGTRPFLSCMRKLHARTVSSRMISCLLVRVVTAARIPSSTWRRAWSVFSHPLHS